MWPFASCHAVPECFYKYIKLLLLFFFDQGGGTPPTLVAVAARVVVAHVCSPVRYGWSVS